MADLIPAGTSLNDGRSAINQKVADTDKNVSELTTRVDNIVGNAGQSNTEIVDARRDSVAGKTFPFLKNRLDDISSGKASKSDLTQFQTYVNSQLAVIGSGSPKGTYATLSALQTAFPTGTTGTFVVQADGYLYGWIGSAWTAIVQYQSTGFAQGSVTLDKLSSRFSNRSEAFGHTHRLDFVGNSPIVTANIVPGAYDPTIQVPAIGFAKYGGVSLWMIAEKISGFAPFNSIKLNLFRTAPYSYPIYIAFYKAKSVASDISYTPDDLLCEVTVSAEDLFLLPDDCTSLTLSQVAQRTTFDRNYVTVPLPITIDSTAAAVDMVISTKDQTKEFGIYLSSGSLASVTKKVYKAKNTDATSTWAANSPYREYQLIEKVSLQSKVSSIVTDTMANTEISLKSSTQYKETIPIASNLSLWDYSKTYSAFQVTQYYGTILKLTATKDVTFNILNVALGATGTAGQVNDAISVKIYKNGTVDSTGNFVTFSDADKLAESVLSGQAVVNGLTVASSVQAVKDLFNTNRKTMAFTFNDVVLHNGDSVYISIKRDNTNPLIMMTASPNYGGTTGLTLAGKFGIVSSGAGGWTIDPIALSIEQAASNTLQQKYATFASKEEVNTLSSKVSKKYIDIDETRKAIGSVLDKLIGRKQLKVVAYGNSITNFQNSDMLAVVDQKTAPIGLAGNSWVRQLWQLLNYDVWNEANSAILSANGNLVFRRFDHSDIVLSNGYNAADATDSAKDWATNRSGAADSWRKNGFGGYTQVITSESSYNKPYVGTMKSGATLTIVIPSTATGCSIVFGKGTTRSTQVEVKINDGSSNVVLENLDMNAMTVTEWHKDYTLTPGTAKTLTITNKTTSELWVWGVEYWTKENVRVINSGLAGNAVTSLNTNFDAYVKNQSPDLVVIEVPALNDSQQLTESVAYTNAAAFFDKLKALNVPVLCIMTHREVNNGVGIQYDRANIKYDATFVSGTKCVGNTHFYPNYIKMYKALASKNGFGIIDMFSKSVDELGGGLANSISAPAGWFVDGIHLGTLGNKSYADELKKVFMWADYE